MFSRRPTSLHPARGVAREAVDHVLIFGPAFAATLTANVMPEGCCNHSQASHLSRRSSADQSRTEGEMDKDQEAELRQRHCLTRRAKISLISSDNIDPILHKSEMLVIVGQCESR